MELRVDIKKALTEFDLEVSFTCRRGTLNVLIGPSGAGKTTIIRMIAGLERPDKGRIAYNGEAWVDVDKGLFLPPQKRRLGYVFQEYTLFPHLSVYKNVAFAATDKGDIERLLKLFGIWHLRDHRPYRISGGERQRCAICQNLARRPQALLLDEPFSALDVENRRRLRRELKTLKNKVSLPMIHVTHDLREALFLGDEILPMVRGKVTPGWLDCQLEEMADEEAGISPPTGRSAGGDFRRVCR
jgi:molybdate transport system ATP-binding protein